MWYSLRPRHSKVGTGGALDDMSHPPAQDSGFKPRLRYTARGRPVSRSMLQCVKDHSGESSVAVATYRGESPAKWSWEDGMGWDEFERRIPSQFQRAQNGTSVRDSIVTIPCSLGQQIYITQKGHHPLIGYFTRSYQHTLRKPPKAFWE